MRGKSYKSIKEKTPGEKVSVKEAIDFLKSNTRSSDQMVRGGAHLPSGAAKQKKVAVFTTDANQQKAAKDAGAAVVGGEELIEKVIEDGKLDAEIAIATPDMMPKLAKAARVLGPQGLMPNPKTGTVADDVVKAVTDLASGKITYKMDQLGNIHEAIGKASWEAEKIQANVDELLSSIKAARPDGAKGEFIRSATLSLTMSPGVQINA